MFQRDYIMRMIEQLGQALQHILRLQQVEKWDAAQMEINRAGKTLLGVDLQLLRSLEEAALPALFGHSESLDGAKCFAAGRLLHEEGRLLEKRNQTDAARERYRRALRLYLPALLHAPSLRMSNHLDEVAELMEKISPAALPDAVLFQLFQFFEVTGQFARAEDMLFFLAERPDTDIFEEGRAFFRRMEKLPPEALQAGNLPPEEVAEGRRHWEKRFAHRRSS